jgi:hypothetical protein
MPQVSITWVHTRASVVARQYRAAVVRVLEAAGAAHRTILVQEADVRRVERAVADMRAAFERLAELKNLIDVHKVVRPDEPPSTTPPAAPEDQAPPPEPSPALLEARDDSKAMMTRGPLLNTIRTERFRQVRARGDAGRQQRMALLEVCFGQTTMREVAMLADDLLEPGLQRLLAREGHEREPGEEG